MSVPANDDQRLLAALLRQDFASFVRKVFETVDPGTEFKDNWHIDAMCHAITEEWRAYSGPADPEHPLARDRRLMITVPPRHLKSITTSVAFPAWVLGHDPSQRFMVASYASELAILLTRDFRAVVQSQWYRDLFPNFGALRQATTAHVVTSCGGGRLGVSLGGSVTGFGADIIIVDDLMKAQDAQSAVEQQRAQNFYQSTLLSRRNNKSRSVIIVVQQRLHENDLVGFLEEGGVFNHLNLPAIAQEDRLYNLGRGRTRLHRRGEALFEANEPLETLKKIAVDIGPATFSCQYLQDPTASESGYLHWDQIETYEAQPQRSDLRIVVQSWDTAITTGPNSDFSVGTTWGYFDGAWYLLDLVRERLEFPNLVAKVLQTRRRWRADDVLIEKAASGYSLLQSLQQARINSQDYTWHLRSYTPKTDKETRFAAQTEKLHGGAVRFPTEAAWLPALKAELIGFPGGKFDDQVDSISQFLDVCHYIERRRPEVTRRNIVRRNIARR